ncbi:hypothetical protein [Clostridium tagluense]|uniref:hypothetical protein n=1 Tax=Clostridium tagluense TaxID=360422 RepID=UPI001C6F0219|nr:hypothetical protein [Clostridium tagluense]MBW9157754.1 hypothetical protein [Clostridium tagluense]WLC66794.1 hypothetical protein KTC93_06290 [Clostridium tagluense]
MKVLAVVISIGLIYGTFKKGEDRLVRSNKIFEEIIYNCMLSKIRTSLLSGGLCQ